MIINLVPGWPHFRVELKYLSQEFEATDRYLNVGWPLPLTCLDHLIQVAQCHVVAALLCREKDEESCHHLVEDAAECPNINLVVVTFRVILPARYQLLGRHQQRRPDVGESALLLVVINFARKAEVSNFHNEFLCIQVNRLQFFICNFLGIISIREVNQDVVQL